MNISSLRLFISISEQQSITLGAYSQKCTQSNATMKIKQLEQDLGFLLFHRVPKGVILTQYGRKFLPYAKKIIKDIDITKVQMQNIKSQNILRVGSSGANKVTRAIPFIRKLQSAYPNIKIELNINGTVNLEQQLSNFELDIAFILGEPTDKELMKLNTFHDSPYIISSKNKRPKKCLLGYREKCLHFLALKDYYEKNNKTNYDTMIIQNYNLLLEFVVLGYGFAFMPLPVIQKYECEDKLNYKKMRDETNSQNSYLICHKKNVPKIKEFLQNLKLD
jgi:DNA-binding transcriptional LysR family regulator